MAIIREPMQATQFTQVPNDWIRDPLMSAKALGALVYLASHAADYNLTVQQIVAQKTNGRTSMRSALRELESLGYLVRHKRRVEGRFAEYDFEIVESPTHRGQVLCSGAVDDGSCAAEDVPLRTPPKNTTEEVQVENTNPSLSPTPARRSSSKIDAIQDRERELPFKNRDEFPDFRHRALGKLPPNYNRKWRDYLIDEIESRHCVDGLGWWIKAAENGTLEDHAKEIYDENIAYAASLRK